MRTSIDIADGLLDAARDHARERGVTLRSLVEEGLREVLGRERDTAGYRYEPVTRALRWRPDIDPGDWAAVRQVLDAEERRHVAPDGGGGPRGA